VADLERRGAIRSPAVRRAFTKVPRERFVPEVAEREGLGRVYADEALVTRTDTRGRPLSSSSQPTIMAEMLEHLDLAPGLRVLEVGTGTGYNAALLAELVGRQGHVTSVELEPDLAARAEAALEGLGYTVEVVVGDARTVVGDARTVAPARYDRVIVTAAADSVPRSWRDALVDGGLIELPLRLPEPSEGEQVVVTLRRQGERLASVAIVPGGFMGLRRPGVEEAPAPGGAGLSVTELVAGRPRSIASLTGAGLARMRPAARRRLAAVMLSPPRARRLAMPAEANTSLVPYVGMAEAPGMVTVRTFRRPSEPGRFVAGAGFATRDGRGLALAVGRADGRGCRLEAYGDGDGAAAASHALDRLVARWRAAGAPSLADCRITMTYGDRPPRGAGAVERDGVFVALQWPA
jgi:protein-L-isoaspartate(D-aspartate) O-methyltransferase